MDARVDIDSLRHHGLGDLCPLFTPSVLPWRSNCNLSIYRVLIGAWYFDDARPRQRVLIPLVIRLLRLAFGDDSRCETANSVALEAWHNLPETKLISIVLPEFVTLNDRFQVSRKLLFLVATKGGDLCHFL